MEKAIRVLYTAQIRAFLFSTSASPNQPPALHADPWGLHTSLQATTLLHRASSSAARLTRSKSEVECQSTAQIRAFLFSTSASPNQPPALHADHWGLHTSLQATTLLRGASSSAARLTRSESEVECQSTSCLSLQMMHTLKYLLSQLQQQLGDPRSIEQLCLSTTFSRAASPPAASKPHNH